MYLSFTFCHNAIFLLIFDILIYALQAKHMFICDSHKNTIQHFRNKQKNREGRNSEHIDLSDRPSQIDVCFKFFLADKLK